MARTTSQGLRPADFDLSPFYPVFFDEAGENLRAMERMLLAIDVETASDEELNAIFRVAHSIKGGASTFGFADVTELTHELETLLDRLRRHELKLTRVMVDALLEAGDVLRGQLARHQDAAGRNADADDLVARIKDSYRDWRAAYPAADAADLVGRIRRLAAAGSPAPLPANVPPARLVRVGPLRAGAAADGVAELFREIPTLGAIESLDGGELSPDGYRRFKVVSPSSDAELLDLFSFHIDRQRVSIAPYVGEDAGAAPPALPAAAAQPPGDAAAAAVGDRVEPGEWTGAALESASLRVPVERVDRLIRLVGELSMMQAMLAEQARRTDPGQPPGLMAVIADLDRTARGLRDTVLAIRMTPISAVFSRFPRLVRQLGARLGKPIELRIVGEATELDQGLIEKIVDPLTHLVRNSADHGIEAPGRRVAAGKPAAGTITLTAAHQDGAVLIEVADDGAGLSRERIVAAARRRGLPVRDEFTDAEVWALIWSPGFTTAEAVSDLSGRGVGMDVVRRNVVALGGEVTLDSVEGRGTRVSIRLPTSLAIMDGLAIGVGGEVYVLPLAAVTETFLLQPGMLRPAADGAPRLQVGERTYPAVALDEVLLLAPAGGARSGGFVVLVEAQGVRVAALVDDVHGPHPVVMTRFEARQSNAPAVCGATVLGDGRSALVVDVNGLVERARR